MVRRYFWLALFAVIALSASARVSTAATTAPVRVLPIEGVIGPATADFFHRELAKASERGVALLVLRMDTPGGLDDAMRRIIKDILSSPVPIATYVAPQGARAASAGTYILYASHIAAMAPATNLGAATPVSIGSEPEPADRGAGKEGKADGDAKKAERRPAPSSGQSLREKAINDAAAYIRGLAQLRGRNAEFAEQAVLQASSLSASEALKGGVIDVMATSVADLVTKIDGKTVALPSGQVTLSLAGAPIEVVEADWRTRALGILSNPMFAMVLMMVGVYGLFVEFTTPGFGVPGVAGTIALLLALYAFQLLPVNWAGVALIALGAAMMIAEVFLPSFGAIGVGGIIAFIVGGLMLFDIEEPALDVGLPFVAALAVVSAGAFAAFGAFVVKARKQRVVSGREDMIGAVGHVLPDQSGEHWALVRGERWRIRGPAELQIGDRVRVAKIDGLTLHVTPAPDDRRS